jgi:hypothetical protein
VTVLFTVDRKARCRPANTPAAKRSGTGRSRTTPGGVRELGNLCRAGTFTSFAPPRGFYRERVYGTVVCFCISGGYSRSGCLLKQRDTAEPERVSQDAEARPQNL